MFLANFARFGRHVPLRPVFSALLAAETSTHQGDRFDLEYVQRLMNGRRTEDALCCFLSCSPQVSFITIHSTFMHMHILAY